MNLIFYPDPRLRKFSDQVDKIDVKRVLKMFNVMYRSKGIGLAAAQVGWLAQVFVMNTSGAKDDELVVINPSCVECFGNESSAEACLSLPGVRGLVGRAASVKLSANIITGAVIRACSEESMPLGPNSKIEAYGLKAMCIQHETEHLAGRLIIDRFSEAKKVAIKPRLRLLEEIFETNQTR